MLELIDLSRGVQRQACSAGSLHLSLAVVDPPILFLPTFYKLSFKEGALGTVRGLYPTVNQPMIYQFS